jgi:hypothetical protein
VASRDVGASRSRPPANHVAHPFAAVLCAALAAVTIIYVHRQRITASNARAPPRDLESAAFMDFAEGAAEDDDDVDASSRESAPMPPPRRGVKLAKD